MLVEDHRVVVTVQPPKDRTVKSVSLKPYPSTKAPATTPHTRVTLPNNLGVRFAFAATPEPFTVVVTLDDSTVREVRKKDWGQHFE